MSLNEYIFSPDSEDTIKKAFIWMDTVYIRIHYSFNIGLSLCPDWKLKSAHVFLSTKTSIKRIWINISSENCLKPGRNRFAWHRDQDHINDNINLHVKAEGPKTSYYHDQEGIRPYHIRISYKNIFNNELSLKLLSCPRKSLTHECWSIKCSYDSYLMYQMIWVR